MDCNVLQHATTDWWVVGVCGPGKETADLKLLLFFFSPFL